MREYCGHGLGRVFHDAPNILHFGKPGTGVTLEEGMFFTVEPMINIGKPATILSKHDGWTVTTRDKSLSAQFEHSLGVTSTGFELFTHSAKGSAARHSAYEHPHHRCIEWHRRGAGAGICGGG